jgi:predicted kinase
VIYNYTVKIKYVMEKNRIKNILREAATKNMLGVIVSRPNQELIVMRGVPGSGKSTESKNRIGKGISHSTDDLIEKAGDYNEFFAAMIAAKDFSPLSKMHAQNINNAISSMKSGVSPVIIDNTNIKMNEPKQIVVAALKMGFSDDNIKFVDIGTAGLEAEELANRNSHGVPLEKIEQMIASHTGQGEMTLKKVVGSKDMYGPSKIAMVVLDDTSKKKLLATLGDNIPEGWDVIAHHMTINFGKGLTGDRKDDLGKVVNLNIVSIGKSDMVIAAGVEGYHSDNKLPHITLAVNKSGGGKPVMSNNITDWKSLPSYINVSGVVTEKKL